MNGPYWDRCPDCPRLPAVPPIQVARSARGDGVTADYLGVCGCVWTTDWALPAPIRDTDWLWPESTFGDDYGKEGWAA